MAVARIGIDNAGGDAIAVNDSAYPAAIQSIGPFERVVAAIGLLDDKQLEIFTSGKLEELVEGVRAGRLDGFVSMANTASIVKESMRLGRLKGVSKPALVAQMPNAKGGVYLLCDAGATCQATNLRDYADAIRGLAFEVYLQGIMASVYSGLCMRTGVPKLGVLSNGTESTKGSPLARAVRDLFGSNAVRAGRAPIYDFVGMVEPSCAFEGRVDVLVTDGFTGNIYLKSAEAAFGLAKGRGQQSSMDVDKYAGAILLGMQGAVVKCHGRSSAVEVAHGIKRAGDYALNNANRMIEQALALHAQL